MYSIDNPCYKPIITIITIITIYIYIFNYNNIINIQVYTMRELKCEIFYIYTCDIMIMRLYRLT